MKKICILIGLLYVPLAAADYKCVDANGKTHFGDTIPEGCDKVPVYEIRGGIVVKKIDPSLTPEQVKAKKDEADKKKAADLAADEQKRKDLALLNSYTTEKDFDVARERNVDPIKGRIRSAKERIEELDKNLKKDEDEMEFYKSGKKSSAKGNFEAPPPLVASIERARKEKAGLEASIARSEKEIVELQNKYTTDKQRWMGLKSGEIAKPAEYLR
jgi:hypothetical protein